MAQSTFSEWYEMRWMNGIGHVGGTWPSLAEAKEAIDNANKSARRYGDEPTQFLITKVTQESIYSNNGRFQRRVLSEVAVQAYPKLSE